MCREARLPSSSNISLQVRRTGGRALSGLFLVLAGCGGDISRPDDTLRIASIKIDQPPQTIERGAEVVFTATATDTANRTVAVPFVWRSSADSVASFSLGGRLIARDTGTTIITASALGVTSPGVQIRVVRQGPEKIVAVRFNPPIAVSPGGSIGDSIRVNVTNAQNLPSVGAIVRFDVTAGGGSVSAKYDTVGATGTAATTWTFGPSPGTNTVTASVLSISGRDTTVTRFTGNPLEFSVRTYEALSVVQGDRQTGDILAALPIAPTVRLVDADGKPRAGVPISFTATGNGRVANTTASTSVDGVATAGAWTLGDASGEQQLVASVEGARLVFRATAMGTGVRFPSAQAAAAQSATCARAADNFVRCMGRPPQIGTGDTTTTRATPTPISGDIRLTTIAGNGAHFCGLGTDLAIYCWGINALVDTLNAFAANGGPIATYVPTRLQSNIAWLQVTPGNEHNCALANDRTAYCWGIDTVGQLGDNKITRRLVPQPVAGGFKFSMLAAGASHECGITLEGAAFCWGLNSGGQIGDGTQTNRLSPTAVTGGLRWRSIGAGNAWTCGLSDTGTTYCWGAGTGRTTPDAPLSPSAPLFTSLSVGPSHACALTDVGQAYCWGDNSGGQLGDETTTSRVQPAEVVTTMRFVSIAAGPSHTCAVTNDGFLACWGRNQDGELGLTVPVTQLTPRYVLLGVTPSQANR